MNFFDRINTFIVASIALALTVSCDESEENGIIAPTGSIEIKIDNATTSFNAGPLTTEAGSTDFNLMNENNNQRYNISVLRYFITEVVLTAEDGTVYEDEVAVSASATSGIYLIDESDISSQRITLEGIPEGDYSSITFKVGIDSGIVAEGAVGGILSQGGGATDTDMFWNWNAGYLAFKMEGQAEDSKGTAFGETVNETDPNGYAFHIGGWSAAMNNNKVISMSFGGQSIDVEEDRIPELHIVMDVTEVLSNTEMIDFSAINNIHNPLSGAGMANNLANAFKFDHIHQ